MGGLGVDFFKQSISVVNIGIGVVIAVMLVGLGAGLWMNRDKLRDVKALLTLIALLSMLPMGAKLIQEKTNLFPRASEEVKIVAVEVRKMTEDTALVYLTLTDPAYAYMEYTETSTGKKTVIITPGKVQERTGHAFEVKVRGEGGWAVFVVDGKLQMWQGQPAVIK